jgi:hypothetical protein
MKSRYLKPPLFLLLRCHQQNIDKLDISDEFKNVLDTIRLHNDDKIRCVLNKADCVTREQLVRVYGSLLWSMGECDLVRSFPIITCSGLSS